jgi:hypothetical protein
VLDLDVGFVDVDEDRHSAIALGASNSVGGTPEALP